MKPHQWRPSARLRKRRMLRHSIIDLSGLVAIILCLLVFFMMGGGSPHAGHGSWPDLVQATYGRLQPGATKEDALQVWLLRDGRIYFGSRTITTEQIPGLIRGAVREGSEPKVYLGVDARAKYGTVNVLLDEIRKAKIENVVLLTN